MEFFSYVFSILVFFLLTVVVIYIVMLLDETQLALGIAPIRNLDSKPAASLVSRNFELSRPSLVSK